LRSEGQEIEKELKASERQIRKLEQQIKKYSSLRIDCLHECKVNGIQLPLLRGNMDRLHVIDDSLGKHVESQF
jgi:hypothetical protein